MGLECSVDDIEKMCGAEFNPVIRVDALEAAKMLKNNYGIDFYYETPYGHGNDGANQG